MGRNFLICMVVMLAALLTSCGLGEFNDGRCKISIEANPVRLDGEQVMLTNSQVECGVQNDLWDTPQATSGERMTARLEARGRALKFDDDVSVAEPGFRNAYVQVRGEFPLYVREIVSTKDDGPGVKLVDVKLGIQIQHVCFPEAVPIMGVRKGRFTQDTNPIVRLTQDGTTWTVERLVH